MKIKRGFTIVEVSLFLAITALLFVGITMGTQNSINQQRYADSVDGFAEFLRNIYSEVSNPQSNGYGNSKQAIYGKLVTFGETHNLSGTENTNDEIFVYDLIGDVSGNIGSGTLQEALTELNTSVIAVTEKKNGGFLSKSYGLAGMVESYTPRWSSRIEGLMSGDEKVMSMIVVRHPRSGTIHTLVVDDVLQINDTLGAFYGGSNINYDAGSGGCVSDNCDLGVTAKKFEEKMKNWWKNFSLKDVAFCVNPFGDSSRRQEIILAKDAKNASGVQVIGLDSEENQCNNNN